MAGKKIHRKTYVKITRVRLDVIDKQLSLSGVRHEATTEGLTEEQWYMVRNPTTVLRAAILAAGDS